MAGEFARVLAQKYLWFCLWLDISYSESNSMLCYTTFDIPIEYIFFTFYANINSEKEIRKYFPSLMLFKWIINHWTGYICDRQLAYIPPAVELRNLHTTRSQFNSAILNHIKHHSNGVCLWLLYKAHGLMTGCWCLPNKVSADHWSVITGDAQVDDERCHTRAHNPDPDMVPHIRYLNQLNLLSFYP